MLRITDHSLPQVAVSPYKLMGQLSRTESKDYSRQYRVMFMTEANKPETGTTK